MIDARMDKTIARLISLKEYKRFTTTHSPPLVPGAPKREIIESLNHSEHFIGIKEDKESKNNNDINV